MSIRSIAIILSLPYFILPQWSLWYSALVFWVGILIIGIPHGAVDNHIKLKEKAGKTKTLLVFILKYLSLMALFFLFWLITPGISVAFFVLISAYHFGMVDFGHPNNWLEKVIATIYGIALLGSIIFSDKEMVGSILEMLALDEGIINWFQSSSIYTPYFLILLCSSIVAIKRVHKLWWTIALLLLGTEMPLLLLFGLYFSFQHALESSIEIKSHLSTSIFKLIKYALPFSIGAYLIGISVYLLITQYDLAMASFIPFAFLFLGMITLPHVFFYSFDD